MIEDRELIELTASAQDAGKRLDAFVAAGSSLSRNAAQRLIEAGDILVNGREAQAKTQLREGDELTVTQPPPSVTDTVPEDIPIDKCVHI